MPITDNLLRLSGTQTTAQGPLAITAGTPIYSTNAIDLQSPTNASGGTTTTQVRDIGEGQDLYAVVTIATALVQATAGSVTFEVILSDNEAGTTNPYVVGSAVIPWVAGNTNLAAGTNIVIRINPVWASRGQRYLQMRYNCATNNVTAGAVFADIVTDISDARKFYASGFTVT